MNEEQATRAVAAGMFPRAEWETETLAYVPCPGASLHTTSNGRKDCRLTINDGMPPTIYCCHNSCGTAVESANYEMRAAIGRLKTVTGNHTRRGMAKTPAATRPAPRHTAIAPTDAPLPQKRALEPLELPEPHDDGQARHLAAVFRPGELMGVVFGHPDTGKPAGRGETMQPHWFTEDPGSGTFVRVNPMRQNGAGDADVSAWRHCLIECDKAAVELQYAAIVASGLPVSVVVHSGGRSVHAWVRVDASTAEEFRERARMAADAMEEFEGIEVDRATLNPSRLARLAGKRRGDQMQELLAYGLGATCWDDYIASRKAPEPQAGSDDATPPVVADDAVFYYRKAKKDYILVKDTDVTPLDKDKLKMALEFEAGIVDADEQKARVWDITRNHGVDYDGSLPGYNRGLHVEGGRRYFVDSEAEWLEGTTCDDEEVGASWPTIHAFLVGLLCSDDTMQTRAPLTRLCWSLKLSREGLRHALRTPASGGTRNVRPGPASVFCGSKGSGKSLLVNSIITPLLGGRVADAHKAFTSGAEGFNGELLGAEVWTVDDKVHACDLKSRRQFAASIKSFLYSGLTGFHAKFKEQISIRPWARLFILCNDQDEAIRVLPVLTDDIADKMHFWRCYSRHQFPTATAEDWLAYGERIRAELPAFAGYLDGLTIPVPFRDPRNGMRCWQDPHIVGLLADQTPEHQLTTLLVHLFDADTLKPIRGRTAQEILEILSNIEAIRAQVRNLVHDDPALLGRYLGRIVSDPNRAKAAGLTAIRTGSARNVGIYLLEPYSPQNPMVEAFAGIR
jgi:hypothetical protein